MPKVRHLMPSWTMPTVQGIDVGGSAIDHAGAVATLCAGRVLAFMQRKSPQQGMLKCARKTAVSVRTAAENAIMEAIGRVVMAITTPHAEGSAR
jgi:hypothetical protein